MRCLELIDYECWLCVLFLIWYLLRCFALICFVAVFGWVLCVAVYAIELYGVDVRALVSVRCLMCVADVLCVLCAVALRVGL